MVKKQDLQWNIIRSKQNYFEDKIKRYKNKIKTTWNKTNSEIGQLSKSYKNIKLLYQDHYIDNRSVHHI